MRYTPLNIWVLVIEQVNNFFEKTGFSHLLSRGVGGGRHEIGNETLDGLRWYIDKQRPCLALHAHKLLKRRRGKK